MLKTVSIIITGSVHGVFFRQTASEKAKALGIKGEVKNLPDESVQVIASGEPEQLEQLIEWCKRGPARARVSNVFIEELPLQSFYTFSIIRW